MNILHDAGEFVELEQLAQSHRIDGVDVTVRCFLVIHPKPHYELVMSGRNESGIVDVPSDKEEELSDQMVEAAVCFATSVRLRQELPS